MRVIITGASGFIGRHTLSLLKKMNVQIIALSRKRSFSENNITWCKLDILDSSAVSRFMVANPADILLHLAWNVEPGLYWTSAANLDWLAASLHLCRCFADAGGQRIVVSGTCAEYSWNKPMPLNEASSEKAPASLYGTCKHALHLALEAYASLSAFSLLWCRFYFLYGPGEPEQKFVSSMLKAFATGQKFVCRAANLERDYLFVRDAASALLKAAFSDISGSINIASGIPIRLGEIALQTARICGAEEFLELENVICQPDNPQQIFACIKRLRDELGWLPAFDIKSGIEAMHNDFADHTMQGGFSRSECLNSDGGYQS